jgi:hypothetical protein
MDRRRAVEETVMYEYLRVPYEEGNSSDQLRDYALFKDCVCFMKLLRVG